MEPRFLKAFILVFAAFLCHIFRRTNSELIRCNKNETCGYNSQCISEECLCNEGFISLVKPVGEKGKDCVDKKCEDGKCVTCIDKARCKRCVRYLIEGTGKCTDECKTEVVFKFTGDIEEGDVCKAPEESKWTKAQTIGLIVGLSLAAVVIIVVVIVIIIIKKRKIDEDTDRQIKEIRARKKEERRERRKARNAANAQEGKQGSIPDSSGNDSSGNVLGAKDFEV